MKLIAVIDASNTNNIELHYHEEVLSVFWNARYVGATEEGDNFELSTCCLFKFFFSSL